MSIILKRSLRTPGLLKQVCYSSSSQSGDATAKTIPKNLVEDKQTAVLQKENGVIFDKRPFKIHLDKEHPISPYHPQIKHTPGASVESPNRSQYAMARTRMSF
ncbi:uncharacterized protein [Drosophila pseudoobscura]|uniref:Uncharacterized protein isoform X3 n=1 Tax=Drosophila pseudoobscura pseudoobscura TaxID=46245 RepID=A0A6I8VV30_DROPS|nr:uncharacterized protein LOC4803406 isoform X3 [Drosophila pseudoobscura]